MVRPSIQPSSGVMLDNHSAEFERSDTFDQPSAFDRIIQLIDMV
jgi:hypothetical protein